MCGIAALSRNPEGSSIPDARRFLRMASHAIEDRGRHATGFAWAGRDGWPWYWKDHGPASRIAWKADLPAGIQNAIVHTRHATLGSPFDNRNNHPVLAPGIVLIHNGRVTNHEAIVKATGHVRSGEVDSEALAALMADTSETSIIDRLEQIEGVAAIAWFDTDTLGDLHLARLTGRPMTLGETRRGDLVMSSTPESLATTARRARVHIDQTERVASGTYLRVSGGEIVERRSFVPHRAEALPDTDMPTRAGQGKRAVPRSTRRSVPDNLVPLDGGIDWDQLVPRRGWKQ